MKIPGGGNVADFGAGVATAMILVGLVGIGLVKFGMWVFK